MTNKLVDPGAVLHDNKRYHGNDQARPACAYLCLPEKVAPHGGPGQGEPRFISTPVDESDGCNDIDILLGYLFAGCSERARKDIYEKICAYTLPSVPLTTSVTIRLPEENFHIGSMAHERDVGAVCCESRKESHAPFSPLFAGLSANSAALLCGVTIETGANPG